MISCASTAQGVPMERLPGGLLCYPQYVPTAHRKKKYLVDPLFSFPKKKKMIEIH
jgi:hypothetical protein